MIVMTRSQDHVEAINSTLRKAGHPVHCTWLPDARDLGDALTQLNPEMLIAFIDELGIDLASIMKVKQQSAPGMPVLIVRENVDEAAIAEAMRLGAQDVVTLANRSRLQSVATRELRAYRLERALSTTLSSAREYREQLQNFLEGSADAITHVQEGIIVDANRAWLELFGYSGDDALTGTPLMDLFEQETHPALKGALVACLQGKWTDHGLKVQALLSDGSTLPLELTAHQGRLRERAGHAHQHTGAHKKDHDLEVQLADAVKNDASTRFLQQRYLIAAVHERCAHGMKGGVRQFAHIKPDRFIEIQNAIGVLASEDFMAQLAELLRSQLTASDLCGRFGGNGFLVMLERGTARDVETWAENVVKRVNEHTFAFEEKTLSATVTVGLGLLPAGQSRRRRGDHRCGQRHAPRTGTRRQSDVRRRQGRHRHARAGLRQDLGQAHQERADGESLPAGAAADREPARRGQGHVRRAGAHARRTGQRSAAGGIHRGRRAQRSDEEHRSLGDRRLDVVCRQPQGRLHFRARLEGHDARQEPDRAGSRPS